MAQNEDISLREPMASEVGVLNQRNTEQEADSQEQAESRQYESSVKRACVILGSAILQLPIWGRL